MSVERDIRFELLARLCPNSTGKTASVAFSLCSVIWLLKTSSFSLSTGPVRLSQLSINLTAPEVMALCLNEHRGHFSVKDQLVML